MAQRAEIPLEGLTGTGGGIIGALAAVGLRAAGNDGRFLWLPGLRDLNGVYTVDALQQQAHMEEIQTTDGTTVPSQARVWVGEWARPVLRNGKVVLLVEEAENDDFEWRIIAKDRIKKLSE